MVYYATRGQKLSFLQKKILENKWEAIFLIATNTTVYSREMVIAKMFNET